MTDDAVRARSSYVQPVRLRRRGVPSTLGCLMMLAVAAAALPARTSAIVSLGAWLQHSSDDIIAANISGLLTLTGDNNIATATIPFTLTIEGVGYTTVAISTNGWF